jgi:response regulator RpfG family c-di-GMP phosphodiesterase
MENWVLLVDDEVNILNSYRRNLRGLVYFDVAASGQQALKLMTKRSYSVLVTDMQMPEMNGIELLQKVREKSPETVRVMLTGNAEQQTAIDAVNIGDIFRFLNKPFSTELLVNAINDANTQYNLIMAEKVLLNNTLRGVITVLNDVLALVNPDAMSHGSILHRHMLNLARELHLKQSWRFEPMIQLSQLGYIIFSEQNVHNMQSGHSISEKEQQLFAQHPLLAADLIRKIPRMRQVARSILYQQKCYNGEGIPHDEVKGSDIPVGSRMFKIVLDYMRYTKKNMSPVIAFEKLEKQKQFYDPIILAAFKKTLSIKLQQKKVGIKELTINMTLRQDINTIRGQLVARVGQQVTESLQQILHHCLHNSAFSADIQVAVSEDQQNDS